MVQAGRDLRRALAQPPAPSRGSYRVTPGCSGLHPAEPWKLPRMEMAQPPWAACSTARLSSWSSHINISIGFQNLLFSFQTKSSFIKKKKNSLSNLPHLTQD